MSVIAVDFDGTLCESKWPEIGEANAELINHLIIRKIEGDKLILWTCREGKELEEAVKWCRVHGLRFDAINDNLPEHIAEYGNNCRKVFADIYIDDKNFQTVFQPRLPTSFLGRLRYLITGKV